MPDLVGNLEDWFSRVAAHLISNLSLTRTFLIMFLKPKDKDADQTVVFIGFGEYRRLTYIFGKTKWHVNIDTAL